MRRHLRQLLVFFWLAAGASLWAGVPSPGAARVAPLIDPARIATLRGERAANDRLLKALYWLDEARNAGEIPAEVIAEAQRLNGAANPARDELVRTALLRNLDIAAKLGCLTPGNLARMRRGGSPVISLGPYAGQPAEVDHIIPLALAPQWGKELANLELLPRELNRRKSASFGERQQALWRKFSEAGMDGDPCKPG